MSVKRWFRGPGDGADFKVAVPYNLGIWNFVAPVSVEKMESPKPGRLRFFSPQLVEETALGHFVEEAPVDKIFWLDFLGPGIDLRDVI